MSSYKSTHIDGDVSVGRHANIGGNTIIHGDTHHKGDVKVDGWLRVPNILEGYKGTFEDIVNFLKGIEVGAYEEGGVSGGKIDGDGNAWLQSLKLRSFLEVPEFRYNRIDIQIGNKWNAPGGGIIERCVPDVDDQGHILSTGTIYLHLEEGEIGAVAVDDICQGIFHSESTSPIESTEDLDDGKGNFSFTGFYTTYFRITKILDNFRNSRFRYALRGPSPAWQSSHHPCEAMHFVGYGNFSDPARQTSRYSTRTYERFLQHVDDWEFSARNVAAQFGDLSNLKVFGLEMTGYSAYLNNIYMSGVIEQFEMIPLTLDIDTEGDSFLAYGEHLNVRCRVFKGSIEKTDQVTRWQIMRDSGFPEDDAVWALRPKVKEFSGNIEIHLNEDPDIDDLGRCDVSCLFTIKAYMENNDTAEIQLII